MQTEILWVAPTLSLLLSYLLGAIPFGVILTRIGGAGDLRTIGSGNIGATNVLRTGRKGLAAATLLLDMAKGAVAVLLVYEHAIVRPDDLTRVNVAFFQVNVGISMGLLAVGLADLVF